MPDTIPEKEAPLDQSSVWPRITETGFAVCLLVIITAPLLTHYFDVAHLLRIFIGTIAAVFIFAWFWFKPKRKEMFQVLEHYQQATESTRLSLSRSYILVAATLLWHLLKTGRVDMAQAIRHHDQVMCDFERSASRKSIAEFKLNLELLFGTFDDSAIVSEQLRCLIRLVPVTWAMQASLLLYVPLAVYFALNPSNSEALHGLPAQQWAQISGAMLFIAWMVIPSLLVNGYRRMRQHRFPLGFDTIVQVLFLALGFLCSILWGGGLVMHMQSMLAEQLLLLAFGTGLIRVAIPSK
jgi:hypothetical protein